MTLTLLTHYLPTDRENYQQLADIVIPERDAYCARHGYRHLVHSGPYHDPALYYAIQRLWRLLDDMNSPDATDAYWVLNVQGWITNHTVPVTQFVDGEHDLYISRDVNGLNAGSFLVRNTERARAYIRQIAERAPHVGHCWWEQKAMMESEEWAVPQGIMKVCPPNQFNSYDYTCYNWPTSTPGHWQPGDLVLSLPGMNLQQRLDLVRSERWQNAVIR